MAGCLEYILPVEYLEYSETTLGNPEINYYKLGLNFLFHIQLNHVFPPNSYLQTCPSYPNNH